MLEPEEFDLNLRSANTKMEARRNKVIEAEAIAKMTELGLFAKCVFFGYDKTSGRFWLQAGADKRKSSYFYPSGDSRVD